ncbi:MAG TPA: FoF1 ATP synthase subunit a [Rectinemataceae bacterium]|nr:FoF1 ATP synthase subunit a [Rectinemataceae bacterium]
MNQAAVPVSIGQRITEAIAIKTVFTLHLFGYSVPISETILASWIVIAVIFLLGLVSTRRLKEIPSKPQVLLEAFIGFINKTAEDNLGHHWREYAAFLGSIFTFLLIANLAPIVSPVGGFGHEAPFAIKPLTRDINITAAFAVVVILVSIASSLRVRNPVGFLKSLVTPVPLMLPFNLLEYIIKPFSLAMRLFGNMLAAFILMQLIEAIMPMIMPPIFSLYFDLFDGLIQAVVFSFLSTIYIAEAIE